MRRPVGKQGLLVLSLAILLCAGTAVAGEGEDGMSKKELLDRFAKRYKEYKTALLPPSSSAKKLLQHPSCQRIMDMGVRVVPLLLEKCGEDVLLSEMAVFLLGIGESSGFREALTLQDRRQLVRRWWKEDRPKLGKRFTECYGHWSNATRGKTGEILLETTTKKLNKRSGKMIVTVVKTEAGRAYDQLKQLGTLILPLAVSKLQEGDLSLLPLITALSRGELDTSTAKTPEETQKAVSSWWRERKDWWTLPLKD